MLYQAVYGNALFALRLVQRIDSGHVGFFINVLDIDRHLIQGDIRHDGGSRDFLGALLVYFTDLLVMLSPLVFAGGVGEHSETCFYGYEILG